MMLVGVGETKNEQDIIEPWVRHHLKLLDRIIVVDDSIDETGDILRKLADEFGGRIIVERQVGFGDHQARRTTELLRRADGADFVFPLDADEFVGATDRTSLEALLQQVPPGGAGLMQWRTFVVTSDTLDACAQDAPRGFGWRRAVEMPPHSKVVVRTAGCDLNDFTLWVGNHNVDSTRGRIKPVELDVPLLHFPVRSREQMLGKAVVRWVACLAANRYVRDSGTSWHVQRNFDELVTGKEMNVCEMSLLYAQTGRPKLVQEVPMIEYERKYSNGRAMAAVPLIAKSWEHSLTS